MKTNFHRRYSRDGGATKRLFIVVAVLVLSIVTVFVLRSPLYSLLTIFFNGENFLSSKVRNTIQLFRSKDSLVGENNLLKDKILYYESLEGSLVSLRETQEEMLKLFGRGEYTSFVSAGVLVRPSETPYDVLIIDAGKRDGVEAGDKVSLVGGGALGSVVESLSGESRVVLYTTSDIKTKGVLDRGDEAVELIGVGGGGFVMLLPKDIEVEVGDKVLTNGVNPELIATVLEITLLPTDSLKKVLLKSVVNLNNVRFVEVHK